MTRGIELTNSDIDGSYQSKIYGVYDDTDDLVFVGTEGQVATYLKYDRNPEGLAVKQVKIKKLDSSHKSSIKEEE